MRINDYLNILFKEKVAVIDYSFFPNGVGFLQVLNGNPYNRKCDVYSFGICLWETYCCDMPYPDLSFSEITSAVVRQVYLLPRFS
jgi:serine/threonine protein kinase